ncbi:MAG TPA: hypothetical protein VHW23_18175 [Kofleriaceae bacterium]|nr:hypothetical protein [Kofleriaceae bacterium]
MRGGLCLGILASSALPGAGCNGVPLCRAPVFVAFAPTQITTDLDSFAPGVQTDVRVESSLLVGDTVTLEVLDTGGTVLSSISRGADMQGGVEFDDVTVPTPKVVLRAMGRGVCGEGHDQITLDVSAGTECALALDPAPEARAYYAPAGVLNAETDPDPVTPGYQATLRAASQPGWSIELLGAGGMTIGAMTAGAAGVASLPITLPDGAAGFSAICRGGGGQLNAPAVLAVVDTLPPSCVLTDPAPGSQITLLSDEDGDPGNGVQLTVVASAPDLDVAGEPVDVSVTEAGVGAIAVPGTVTGDDGIARAPVTLVPARSSASYDVAVTMHDHAGNACTAVATYRVDL